jgi:hypothetical protein
MVHNAAGSSIEGAQPDDLGRGMAQYYEEVDP